MCNISLLEFKHYIISYTMQYGMYFYFIYFQALLAV